MSSFGDLFANNKLLAIGVLLFAAAVILAVGIALFRLVFGRRLHMSGGRTRQPRLGVVDAFDLDRQRQLVLVRRDNVEHLLMIGGPNDVVIEAAIVRAPATLSARDKENGISAPIVGIPAPVAQPAAPPMLAPAAPIPGPSPAIDFEPNGSTAAPRVPEPVSAPPDVGLAPEPALPQAPPVSPDARVPPAAIQPAPSRALPGSPGPRPASAIPVRPQFAASSRAGTTTSLPPRPTFSRATPLASPAPPSAAPPSGRVEPPLDRASAGSSVDVPAAANKIGADPGPDVVVEEIKAPSPAAEGGPAAGSVPAGSTTQQTTPAPTAPGAQGSAPATPSRTPMPGGPRPASPPLRPQPPRPPATPPQNRAPLPTLGSLEEEMAKLLGRPMPPTDQSGG